ncbi:GNAT family N-acetyltransferase [Kroppenstedtia pulmonis]|uniref:GNAT family N-acetyltransferase n=1 Tax=Kroppenstedtia pulmonis TaxID=1380685 RepID=A0A7D3XJL4_9BACL|nr:GNAT family protein [Kroppenstedtia pulmonis]QKG85224.1 GNAT family N-acetyltransferase [Kroppenstedtia pulmonis]
MITLYTDGPAFLTLLQREHARPLFRLIDANRSFLQPWLPWMNRILTVSDMENYILSSLSRFHLKQEAHFGIWYKGELAGSVTVERIDSVNQVAEIGYWLAPAFTGNGIMTKAVQRLIDYLIQERRINRVEIRTEATNRSSQTVALRLGFCHEGTLREAGKKAGVYVDHYLFGLVSSQWHKE